MKTSKLTTLILAGVVVFAMVPQRSFATGNIVQNERTPLRWSTKAAISYMINPNGVAGFTTDLQKIVVTGAVDDAFRAWSSIPGASIHFTDSGTTTLSGTAVDDVNVISFQDPGRTYSFPPGVLAATSVVSGASVGQVTLPNGTLITVDFAGQIIDADIVFNPNVSLTPVGGSGADLVAILTHEVGHLLGLDHTGVMSSIMNPFGESGSGVASRTVQSDDANSAAALYPDASFTPAAGAISGTVTNSSGAPVKSAHVVAISFPAGVPVESQLTGADGTYRIAGIPAGNYQVMVEPLDGPVGLSNFPGYYSSGQNNFATTFLGGVSSPTTIPVSSGQTASANVVVPAQPASPLNITLLASSASGGGLAGLSFSVATQYLPRGRSYQLLPAGSNLGSDANMWLSVPSTDVSLQGATSTPANLQLTGLTVRQQNITVSPTAALGPSNLSLANASSTSVIPGGIVVTVNPNIAASLDGAGFATSLAPGTIFSIFGTDLAPKTDGWLGAPAPTSLGGISVKIGNRYAPLFYVSPTQINGMVPYEVSGNVTATIEAGPGAAGNSPSVSLAATTPGIFSAESSGKGQGAILNGGDLFASLTAPTGAFPGSHPAKAGDVIVIYASGLGPVSPVLPSGVGSGTNGSQIPTLARAPQVRIGGQTVAAGNVQFAGLSPGFVGLYQVNVQLPAGVATGNAVPVQITTAESQTSNTVTIAIQ